MGNAAKYAYQKGELISVTEPGEDKPRWQFAYDEAGRLQRKVTDGRGGTLTTEYNGGAQVVSQTDALGRKRKWEYETTSPGTETIITEPNGSKTSEKFNAEGLPTVIKRAVGTAIETVTTNKYDSHGNLTEISQTPTVILQFIRTMKWEIARAKLMRLENELNGRIIRRTK